MDDHVTGGSPDRAVAFEDLAPGQIFRAGPIRMTRERIMEFGAEFDPQPQHLSEEQAARSIFGTLVASDWHTAAVTIRMMVESAPLAAGSMGAGVEDLSWRAPVRPGDELSCESEIITLRPSRSRPDRGVMTLRITTRNQRGEIVMEMTSRVILPRRSAG
jgi:acyl dehydratase